ncbi:LacI family DNA-binding transcriptional regulator [Fusibacter ferrireducens]|uniref:LacI family DNA-binding transcriptional regulator n=1 Tax=Fusibacter ferrireducens TaxID=2785058 RepID=A0ABR9ZQE9_9FIRM|nr:LacI family DNA-binding transcriptional regulator [Fusibacter ferrireducens]MBF4692695.1 LacI family DNA-binding transcriptional regulator [Fusibacter ferrireducens]
MKITINEIAKKAGVSKATVSRVLNNSKPVNESLRKRVLQVIEETNFRPNALARGLSLQKTRVIGVIIPDLSNPVFSRIIAGIESYTRAHDYSLMITATDYDISTEIKHINLFRDKGVEGLILLTDDVNQKLSEVLGDFSKPIIMIGSDCDLEKIPVIKIDNMKAAYEATQYLINLNHKRIAMIRGPLTDRFSGNLRFEGYKKALVESGIYDENLVKEGKYSFEHGYQTMTHLLAGSKIPTAIFCANDVMAVGALKCALDNDLNVPEELSIMGFDDIEIAKIYTPSLSSVHQPFEAKGERAIAKLIHMIESEADETISECAFEDEVLEHRLIIRQSTKRIKS